MFEACRAHVTTTLHLFDRSTSDEDKQVVGVQPTTATDVMHRVTLECLGSADKIVIKPCAGP